MNLLKLKSYAKINLGLEIVGKRFDGYHNLRSIFQEINLFDLITFKKSSLRGIRLTCSDPTIPIDKNNTVFKAAELLLNIDRGVEIHIQKKIPHQAGLGGGSSNAAATLVGLNQLFKLGLSDIDLLSFAEKIGADVPFFLFGKQALVSGIGNIIQTASFPFIYQIVLLKPEQSFSTQEIYSNYTKFLESNIEIDFSSFLANPNKNTIQFLHNDLEKAIDNPIISKLKSFLIKKGAFYTSMTGSGSVVYGLFDKQIELSNIPNNAKLFTAKAIY